MREIKFRAWDKLRNIMLEPNHPDIFIALKNQSAKDYDGENVFNIMQFTGLLDKNGVEIYEGDIIYTSFQKSRLLTSFDMYLREIYHIVKWDGISWNIPNIELEFRESVCTAVYNMGKELPKWEVVGNIHENNFKSL